MNTTISDDFGLLVRYFLGELPEQEQESVEERYMADQQFSELRDEVEMDLVDAYAAGTLTALQKRRFERHYLITNERKEAVRAAYLTRAYREHLARPAAQTKTNVVPFMRPAVRPQRPDRRLLIAALAAAVADILIGGTLWLMLHKRPAEVVQTARVEPPAVAAPPVAPPLPPKVVARKPVPAPGTPPLTTNPVIHLSPPATATNQISRPGMTTATASHAAGTRSAASPAEAPVEPPPPPAEIEPAVTPAAVEIRDALASVYHPASTVVALRKDKVLMVEARSSNQCENTYAGGRITQAGVCGAKVRKFSKLPHQIAASPASRAFVSGEKFWITKINVTSGERSGIELQFLSDPIDGVRYGTTLRIPFGDRTPSLDEALRMVAEVLSVAPSDHPPTGAAISLGQTIDQVVAALGQPLKRIKAGARDIYYYQDRKVTFVDGKVADIQ